jgi:predicted dehydrogenase
LLKRKRYLFVDNLTLFYGKNRFQLGQIKPKFSTLRWYSFSGSGRKSWDYRHRKIRRNEIGTIRAVQASFGFQLADSSDVRLDPTLDGGSLMDTGCYCLSFIRQIMGERGTVSFAKAHMTPSGVDLMMQANLAFSGDRWAQVFCNMNSAPHRHASIIGSQGVIQTDFVNHTHNRPSYLQIKQGTDWDSHLAPISYNQANGFFAEAEAFANLIAKADWAAAQHWASISADTAGMLDDILTAAK